jgi:hypothetical protein
MSKKDMTLVSYPFMASSKTSSLKPIFLDLVIWDSHPLALGATPKQVFIDGIPQFGHAFVNEKPDSFQKLPRVPNFGKEADRTVQYEGLPPLEPLKPPLEKVTVFLNVKSIVQPNKEGLASKELHTSPDGTASPGIVIIERGKVVCAGDPAVCGLDGLRQRTNVDVVDLEGGSIVPGLTTYGSPVGLEEINQEPSTNDGTILDPLTDSIPALLGGDTAIIRASDGLEFGSRDAL